MLHTFNQFSVLTANQQIDYMPWWAWLILFMIMLIAIFWYWINRKSYEPTFEMHGKHDEHDSTSSADHGHTTHAVIAAVTPQHVDEPVQVVVKSDDLKVIEGIGPKVQIVLNNIGIFTFQQLASANMSDILTALEVAGYQYMDPRSWVSQASLAAEGRWEDLQMMQDSLKGGR